MVQQHSHTNPQQDQRGKKTMQEEKMNPYRKTAIIAGVLFITATVADILSLPFLAPTDASNDLARVSAQGNQVIIGALLAFIGAFAVAGIAIALYPLLRKYHKGLALGAVGFRLIEAVFYLIGVVCLLLLVPLSQAFVKAGAPASSYFQTFGLILLAGHQWAGNVVSGLAFCLGALMYYYIFYHTKLIPRWLSGWGLVGATLSIVSDLLVMFSLIGPLSTTQVVLNLPIAVQEMVLAVWLIVRGFDVSVIASGSAKTEVTEIKRAQYST
jgi:Domain of unknown function (DUF4386)